MRAEMRFGAIFTLVCALSSCAAGSDLESVRALLDAKGHGVAGANPLGLEIAGYRFHWALEPSRGSLVIALSRNLGGALLSFDRAGSLVGTRDTGEFVWLQACDLDEDGVAEVLTEETVERGTGVLTKAYRLYQLDGLQIHLLWEVESFARKLIPSRNNDQFVQQVTRSYIRCEPSGGGQTQARLLLLTETMRDGEPVVPVRRAFSLSGGHLTEVSW